MTVHFRTRVRSMGRWWIAGCGARYDSLRKTMLRCLLAEYGGTSGFTCEPERVTCKACIAGMSAADVRALAEVK